MNHLVELALQELSGHILQSLSGGLDKLDCAVSSAHEMVGKDCFTSTMKGVEPEPITKRRAKGFFKICVSHETQALYEAFAKGVRTKGR